MGRARCRFTVTTRAGDPIGNAAVTFTDSETEAAVDVYAAQDDVSPAAQPVFSEADASVAVWLDSATPIDAHLTDNGGAAYLAAAPTTTVTFPGSTKEALVPGATEADEIAVDATELALSDGATVQVVLEDLDDALASASDEFDERLDALGSYRTVTIFGAPDDLAALEDVDTLPTGHSVSYRPVSGFGLEPGQMIWFLNTHRGKVIVGTMASTGNPLPGSFVNSTVYVFTPNTETWRRILIETDLGETGVVGANGYGAGDVADVIVTDDRVIGLSSYDYRGWNIATYGRYPAWMVLNEDLTDLDYDLSLTVDELQDAALDGNGAASFPDAVNSYAETYAQNGGMFEAATLPNGWVVIADYLFGALKVLDADGAQRGYFPNPGMQMEDATQLTWAPRDVAADPSSTDPDDMRFTVIHEWFVNPGGAKVTFMVQEFSVNASTGEIAPVCAPVSSVNEHAPAVPSGAGGGYQQAIFDEAGTCWLGPASTSGYGLSGQPIAAWVKTDGERRWASEAPASAGWNDRIGEFRLHPDFQLGVTDVPSQIVSSLYVHPETGGVAQVGQQGNVYPFIPDTPLELRPNLIGNPDFVADAAGWGTIFGASTIAWDAGDGGRLAITAVSATSFFYNGASPYNTANGAMALPEDSAGQSFYGWVRLKPNTTARTVRCDVQFFDAAGAAVGAYLGGASEIEESGSYVTAAIAAAIPVGATQAKVYGSILSTPAGEVHFCEGAYGAVAPVTHLPTVDMELSVLPLAPGTASWPTKGTVDGAGGAWLPITQAGAAGAAIPQYLARIDLPSIFGYQDLASQAELDAHVNDAAAHAGAGSDPSAIHDDVAGEIAAVAAKASPVGADLVLIEDSAAANAKKRVTLTNLLAVLVDAAPGTLDTLNELAAALADDPAFATTVTNLIAAAQQDIDDLAAAAALRANNLSDLASAATAFANIKQPATDSVAGVVEHATAAEAEAWTDTTRTVTPATALAAIHAWELELAPAGAVGETYSRHGTSSPNTGSLASGSLRLVAVKLLAGKTVTSIEFHSATTAMVTPTNWWFGLLDLDRNWLRLTADQLTAGWTANTPKRLALTSPFVPTYSGWHFFGIMVAAATVPSLLGHTTNFLPGILPVTSGSSNSGQTTPPAIPSQAAGLTAVASVPYAYAV